MHRARVIPDIHITHSNQCRKVTQMFRFDGNQRNIDGFCNLVLEIAFMGTRKK